MRRKRTVAALYIPVYIVLEESATLHPSIVLEESATLYPSRWKVKDLYVFSESL